jgi:hypothetical protein
MIQQCRLGHDYDTKRGCDKCYRIKKKARERTALGNAAPPEGFEARKVTTDRKGAVVSVQSVPGQDVSDDFSPIVPAEHYVQGVSTYVSSGETTAQWIKTDRQKMQGDALRWAAIQALIQDNLHPFAAIPAPTVLREDLCNGIVFGDPHFGMLAQARETGGQNWDMKIAKQVMLDALDVMFTRLPVAGSCLLINVGDYFHFQDPSQLTPRGKHKQDGDGRLSYMAELGVWLSIEMTKRAAATYYNVAKFNVGGNHDPEASRWLNIAERIYFRDNPRVTVHDNAADHLFWTFGQNLIGMYHGHETPLVKLPGVMAAEQDGKLWGAHKHRRWVTGHHHNYEALAQPGVLCEKFPTLAPLDMYAAGHGYRSERSLNAFILHAEHGEIGRAKVMAHEVEKYS